MAASAEGRRLTEQHRLAQQQNRAAFLAEFIAVWALLDTARLDETSPGWIRTVLRLVQEYRIRSAQISVGYFVAYRRVEAPATPGGEPIIEVPRLVVPSTTTPPAPVPRPGRRAPVRTGRVTPDRDRSPEDGRGRVRVTFPDLPPQPERERRRARIVMPDLNFEREDRAVRVSLEVTGPIAQKDKIRRAKLVEVARDESFVHASGAATRHVLTGGRKSLLSLVDADSRALGWARVTDGDPCAFCAMLASRGPVYGSAQQAGFSAHDACACTAEPVYSRSAPWPGRAREFQRLWREATQNTSGRDSINAFRRAYEQMQRDQRRGSVA